jgi:hypothetical protein
LCRSTKISRFCGLLGKKNFCVRLGELLLPESPWGKPETGFPTQKTPARMRPGFRIRKGSRHFFMPQKTPFSKQQARLYDNLPLLWESYRRGRLELLEEELRLFLAVIQKLHLQQRHNEENAYSTYCRELERWNRHAGALRQALPVLARQLDGFLPRLDSALQEEHSPEHRSQLSFCFRGLHRLASFKPDPQSGRRKPAAFPLGPSVEEAGKETIAKALADLRKAGVLGAPAELLGRLEGICVSWWQSHLQLAEFYAGASDQARRLAAAVRIEVGDSVKQHVLPVLDALDTSMAAGFVPGGILDEARNALIAFLAQAGVEPMETRSGDSFDPALHQCPEESSRPHPGRRVAKVIRRGYRAGIEVVRQAEVELG